MHPSLASIVHLLHDQSSLEPGALKKVPLKSAGFVGLVLEPRESLLGAMIEVVNQLHYLVHAPVQVAELDLHRGCVPDRRIPLLGYGSLSHSFILVRTHGRRSTVDTPPESAYAGGVPTPSTMNHLTINPAISSVKTD